MTADKRELPHRGNSYLPLAEKDLDTIRSSYAALNSGDLGTALAALHRDAVGRESGAEVSARYAHVWTLRDGLGARVEAYYDSEAALRDFDA